MQRDRHGQPGGRQREGRGKDRPGEHADRVGGKGDLDLELAVAAPRDARRGARG